jgi:hypothetical protein
VPVVAALVRAPSYLEAVMTSQVTVDGDDADEVIEGMVLGSRYREQIAAVLVDGIALGGFNVVDIVRLNHSTGIAFATVTRDRPDPEAIGSALQKHFSDHERRMEVISRLPLHEMRTDHSPIYVTMAGIDPHQLAELLRLCTVQGAIPEPLRAAHLIATAMVKGESYGRA